MSNQHTNPGVPHRIFSTGSLANLPHFDPVAQLCAASNSFGWTTTTSQSPDQLKRKAKDHTEEMMRLLLECMGTQRWDVNELRAHANATNGTKLKGGTVRDYLNALVSRKAVVKSMAGRPHKFWRA